MVDARADDAQLVEAARAGDRDAFAAIFDRYAPRVHAFCTRLLNEPHTASDATQDTFVTAARRLDQLRDPASLRAWLYAIARNECTRHGRARARAVPTEDAVMAGHTGDDLSADEPASAAAASETGDVLWDAADGLDESDRLLLELHLRHGLDGAELAEAAGVPAGQISMVTGRMRERVARSVGALLVARMGRADCPGLQVVLADWDGTFSVLTRKRVARHIDRCDRCEERRAALVAPFGALAVGPTLVTFTLPDGALDELRERVLDAFDQRATGGGAGADDGAGPQPRSRRRLVAALAAAAVLVAALAIGALATRSDDEPLAVRSGDRVAPTTALEAAPTGSTDPDAATTTQAGASTTAAVAPTSPAQAGSTTTPGQVAAPGNPAGGAPAVTAPPVLSPPVTVAPTTAPPANRAPTIGSTSRSGTSAMQTSCNPSNATRTVTVSAADAEGLAAVVLHWTQAGGGSGQRAMSRSGGTWSATLGPFADPGDVTYRAVATDTNGATASSPAAAVTVDPCPG